MYVVIGIVVCNLIEYSDDLGVSEDLKNMMSEVMCVRVYL